MYSMREIYFSPLEMLYESNLSYGGT
jgi:hypothetical protein